MSKPSAGFAGQLAAFWYYLYVAPSGFDPARPDGTGPFVYQSFNPGESKPLSNFDFEHFWFV